MVITKLEIADIDGYDWNWVAKYEDEIVEELISAYSAAYVAEFPGVAGVTVQRIAGEWAREKAATMIQGVADTTRERVRSIVAGSILEGASIETTTDLISMDHAFSPEKARTIARTETAIALGEGQKGAAISQGRDEKHWMTSGAADDICLENESQGWIPIDTIFAGNVDTVPQHPNCRCVVRYRTKDISEDEVTTVSPLSSELIETGLPRVPEFRCVGCNRLLGKDVADGTRIKCRQCKAERIA